MEGPILYLAVGRRMLEALPGMVEQRLLDLRKDEQTALHRCWGSDKLKEPRGPLGKILVCSRLQDDH